MYHFFWIPQISDIIWCLSFSVWLTSLGMTVSRFIHVAANDICSFYGWVVLRLIFKWLHLQPFGQPYIFFYFWILFYFFIQQVLISHQFYTHQCIHVNPNCPIQHTTISTPLRLSPLGVHTFVLYICVSTSALQTGSSVPFF